MAMWTVIAKNSSGSTQTIEDLGVSILDTQQFDLSESFTFDEIAGSDDLRAHALAGTLVINDGSGDLSAANGVLWLTLTNAKDLIDNHYTETEMQTSGQSQMHWDNITNAPSFAEPGWVEPVICRVLERDQGTPPAGVDGDFYLDNQATPHLWWYDSAAWNDQGAISEGDRFIDLNDADESIYEWESSAWTDHGANSDNDAVMVDDDGDGKQSQYIYDTTGTTWTKIGDVDFGGHLDGGASKHDAGEIDVEGTYTNFTSPTDLETALGSIDTALGNGLDHNSLDEAYDEGGAGVGRTITADNGAVKLDPAAGGYAPLELVPTASLPSNDLQDGQVCTVGGIMYIYDATRTLWISVQRMSFMFGRAGKTRDQYLDFGAGGLPTNNSGVRLIRDAVITGISVQLDATGTCTVSIRKNDSATDLLSLAVSGTIGSINAAANLATLVDGDYLQCYLAATTKVNDPVVMIELGWRID